MTVWKFQIIDLVTGEPDGTPYRYVCRCLMRVQEMNIYERAQRYTLKPVRIRE